MYTSETKHGHLGLLEAPAPEASTSASPSQPTRQAIVRYDVKTGLLHHSQLGGPSSPATLAIVGGGIHLPGDGLDHTRSEVITAKGKITHTTGPGSQVPRPTRCGILPGTSGGRKRTPKSPRSALEKGSHGFTERRDSDPTQHTACERPGGVPQA